MLRAYSTHGHYAIKLPQSSMLNPHNFNGQSSSRKSIIYIFIYHLCQVFAWHSLLRQDSSLLWPPRCSRLLVANQFSGASIIRIHKKNHKATTGRISSKNHCMEIEHDHEIFSKNSTFKYNSSEQIQIVVASLHEMKAKKSLEGVRKKMKMMTEVYGKHQPRRNNRDEV